MYQVSVILALMFQGQHFAMDELKEAGVTDGGDFYDKTHKYSQHYTMVFNTYVLMQLFNEINSRKLLHELNPFEGITNNKYFSIIWPTTVAIQIIFASVGGPVIGCSSHGLTGAQWGICFALGAGVIPWQFLVNLALKAFKSRFPDMFGSI